MGGLGVKPFPLLQGLGQPPRFQEEAEAGGAEAGPGLEALGEGALEEGLGLRVPPQVHEEARLEAPVLQDGVRGKPGVGGLGEDRQGLLGPEGPPEEAREEEPGLGLLQGVRLEGGEEGEEGEYEEEDQASSDSDGEDAQEREQAALDAAKTRPSRRTKREQAEASEIEQAKLDEAVKNAEAFFTPGGEGESAHFARMNALKEGEMCAEDALSAIGEETRMLAPHAPAKTSFAGI